MRQQRRDKYDDDMSDREIGEQCTREREIGKTNDVCERER